VKPILRFCTLHTWPGLTRTTMEELRRALRHDPDVRLLRILGGPDEGRLVCVVDAFEREAVPRWFAARGYPLDTVFALEYEGDHGSIHQVAMFAYVEPGEEPEPARPGR
jgi:hypothetical protein